MPRSESAYFRSFRGGNTVWESRSGGKCLFIMPDGPDLDAITNNVSGSMLKAS